MLAVFFQGQTTPLTQTLGQRAIPQAVRHAGEGRRSQQVEAPLALIYNSHSILKTLREALVLVTNSVFHQAWVGAVHHCREEHITRSLHAALQLQPWGGWQPTPGCSAGESQGGQRSRVGCSPGGHKEADMAD